jgi:hypothetical protein
MSSYLYYNNNEDNNTLTKLMQAAMTVSVSEAAAPTYSERLGEDLNGDMWIRSFLINTKRGRL